ncbi:MAG: hypothetical protein PHI59_08720 [Candidatus Omnitrophica bacterium]|nr:hypothetical protein [Candidatus Omnitrophota bacterium]
MNSYGGLLNPPVTFVIIIFVTVLLSYLSSRIAYRGPQTKESKKAYACGEEFSDHLIQPDYSQFFPFAFFFTILHVMALVIATVPVEKIETFTIAVVYVLSAAIGLFILLRRQT